MKLQSLIHKSCYATIATITKDSFDKLNFFFQYNGEFIKQFPRVIISTNSLEDTSIHKVNQYHNTWRRMVPNCVILHSDKNRGHMFGTIDLEESILKHVKRELPEIQYLWKSMDDVITTTDLLDLEVEEAEFYYLPGFSYESIQKAGGKKNLLNTYEIFDSGFYTPQTPFFILNISSIDNIYGNDIDTKTTIYEEVKARNPSIKPWEVPFNLKFDCETHLGRTTKDLKKFCLLKDQFEDLLDMVEINKIGDPSHKGLYFKEIGVCHYHNWETGYVYEI